MNWPDSRTASNRLRSSSLSGAYCAWTSTSGMFGTAVNPSPSPGNARHSPERLRSGAGGVLSRARISLIRALPASFPRLLLARPDWGGITGRGAGPSPVAPDSGHDEQENRPGDDVLRVPEAVVEVLPLGAGRPAGARERERPDHGAGDRQQRVAAERHAEDAGRDRDERPHDRGHPAERDRPVTEAVEPRLGPMQSVRRDVQPASAPLDERPSAVVADPPASDRAQDVAERPGGA